MTYTPGTWVEGQTVIHKSDMDRIEQGIATVESEIAPAVAAEAAARTAAITAQHTADIAAFDPMGAASGSTATALQKASNLSDVASPSTARTNLGLGSAATHATTDYDAAGAATTAQAAAISAAATDATAKVATETTARINADALLIPLTQKAAASGVASLDSGSKIPVGQVPDLSATYALVATTADVVNSASYASIAAALTAGAGKTVHVPAGTTVTLTTALAIPANTRLEFGLGCTLNVPNSSVINGITLAAGASLIGNGLVLDGGGAKATDMLGISAVSVTGVTIDGVTVQNWHGDAIRLAGTDRARVRNCYVNVVTRTNSFFGTGIRLTNAGATATTTTNAFISGCHVRSCAGSGIQGDGDYNHSDWRVGAYAKVADTTITDCTSHSNTFAGIWINSAVRCTISDSHANSNGDYGFGYEYSLNSTIDGCTANGNTTNGMALYASDDGCTISNCTATGNTVDGVMVKWANLVSGDTASTGNKVVGCTTSGNASHGIEVTNANETVVSGCYSNADATGVDIETAVGVDVSGCIIRNSTGIGVRVLSNSSNVNITGNLIQGNASYGLSSGGSNAVVISGNRFADHTTDGAIYLSAAGSRHSIIANSFRNNTHAVYGENAAVQTEIIGNTTSGHSGSVIQTVGSNDWRVIGNVFDEAVPAIQMYDNAGTSPARLVITNNVIKTGAANGIRVSAGTLVSSGDGHVIADNTIVTSTALIAYQTMGSVAGIEFRGSGTGSPESVVYAKPGSTFRRTDGGATTSFYVKESGVGNTGWIAYGAPGAGALTRSVNVISTPTTAGATTLTDYVYLVSGTTTLTLPTAVGNTNRYTVKNSGSNTVTIATTSSQTIDGSSTASLPVANTSLDLISDGTNWKVI